jgi:hypothetical protein
MGYRISRAPAGQLPGANCGQCYVTHYPKNTVSACHSSAACAG